MASQCYKPGDGTGMYECMVEAKEKSLVKLCQENNVGFIAMKGLAGGLINRSKVAMAFMQQYDGVMPIWAIQHMTELEEWLSYYE